MAGRRKFLQTAGAFLTYAALPKAALAHTPPALLPSIKPPRLNPGDTVGLVSPASLNQDPVDYDIAEDTMRAMGLVPKRGEYVGKNFGYFSAKDEERAADINAMFADDEVKGIFAIRGGWGCARILPFLDYDLIRNNPKPLIGYSDITALHLAFQAKTGVVSFHGPNATAAWGSKSLESFKPIVFEGALYTYQNPEDSSDRLVPIRWRTRTLSPGKAQGRLIGGNLTVMSALIGTPYVPDMTGAILFLEDIDEAEYRVDRMLTQLALSGAFNGLAGIVFGKCTSCEASSGSRFALSEILDQHLSGLGIPVFQGAYFGHLSDQFTLPVGVRAEMDANAGTLRLLESAVV